MLLRLRARGEGAELDPPNARYASTEMACGLPLTVMVWAMPLPVLERWNEILSVLLREVEKASLLC